MLITAKIIKRNVIVTVEVYFRSNLKIESRLGFFLPFLHDDKSSILIFSQRTINNYDYQLALINWYRILRFTTHLLIPVSHYFLIGFSKVTINKKSFKNLKPLFLIIKSVSFYENSLCNNITILVQRNISNNRTKWLIIKWFITVD